MSGQGRETAAQRGYDGRWQKARVAFLLENPLCCGCRGRGLVVGATVVDHIKPHRMADALRSGDPQALAEARRLFWDKTNWQGLCANCHNSDKQRLERSGTVAGCDARGVPLDPNHHWNRPRQGGGRGGGG